MSELASKLFQKVLTDEDVFNMDVFYWGPWDGDEPSTPPRGPFSDELFADLRHVIVFLAQTENEHGLGCEALDCILERYKAGHELSEGIWKAICEWDL